MLSTQFICYNNLFFDQCVDNALGGVYNYISRKEVINLSIAKRVAMIRKSNNLTQKEFGEKLGVSRDVIFNIESERVKAKNLFLTHLSEVFNVNKEWILTGEGEMFIVPDNDALLGQAFANIVKSENATLNDIVAKLSTLDEEYLDLIEHLIDTLAKKK